MSTIQDKMKAAREGSGSGQFPKLTVDVTYDLRLMEKGEHQGKVLFRRYDKEKKEHVFINKPMTGIFIGIFFRASCHDNKYGTKGATYVTAPYLRSENMIIFSPGREKKFFKGTKKQIIQWLSEQGAPANLKVKTCILLATEHGLFEVDTNCALAIHEFSKIKEEDLFANFIRLTPDLYDPNDISIPKEVHEVLGKFREKNPPRYASVSLSKAFTDEDVKAYNVDKHLDMYITWKEHILGGGVSPVEDKDEHTQETTSHPPKTEEDDLPF